jgi:hypothetical protein
MLLWVISHFQTDEALQRFIWFINKLVRQLWGLNRVGPSNLLKFGELNAPTHVYVCMGKALLDCSSMGRHWLTYVTSKYASASTGESLLPFPITIWHAVLLQVLKPVKFQSHDIFSMGHNIMSLILNCQVPGLALQHRSLEAWPSHFLHQTYW